MLQDYLFDASKSELNLRRGIENRYFRKELEVEH